MINMNDLNKQMDVEMQKIEQYTELLKNRHIGHQLRVAFTKKLMAAQKAYNEMANIRMAELSK